MGEVILILGVSFIGIVSVVFSINVITDYFKIQSDYEYNRKRPICEYCNTENYVESETNDLKCINCGAPLTLYDGGER